MYKFIFVIGRYKIAHGTEHLFRNTDKNVTIKYKFNLSPLPHRQGNIIAVVMYKDIAAFAADAINKTGKICNEISPLYVSTTEKSVGFVGKGQGTNIHVLPGREIYVVGVYDCF